MSDYPEHEKLRALNGKNETIGTFLDWLDEQGLTICLRPGVPGNPYHDEYFPNSKTAECLLAEFFEIDRKRLEEERHRILDALRAAGGEGTGTK